MSLDMLVNSYGILSAGRSIPQGSDLISGEELTKKLAAAEESPEVQQFYLKDIGTIFGKAMNKVMDRLGYPARLPDHYTVLDLPENIIAATITGRDSAGKESVIFAYNSKHLDALRSNGLFRLYVNLHEHGHVRSEKSEATTEGLVSQASEQVYQFANSVQKGLYSLGQLARSIGQYASQRQQLQQGK